VRLAEFDFDLPADRIAQFPARPRDAARLLHVAADGLHDRVVRDLPALLRPGDLLVVNDTKVIPAQLEGMRGGARIGVTLDRPLPDGTWHVLLRNARRVAPGDAIAFPAGVTATLRAKEPGGAGVLAFDGDPTAAGVLALPPYIARPEGPTASDESDYQTMFAERPGAVAAPTASLHFTPALTEALDARGVGRATVTLHVGAGTFLPVRTETVTDHRLHAERGEVGEAAAQAITAARDAGGRIVAVGTTALRLLETAADETGRVRPWSGETDLFLLPGHRFRTADLLMTNFHLPRSTLFMLVCAFAGPARMKAAYGHAIASGYRFYSYGDSSLLERAR